MTAARQQKYNDKIKPDHRCVSLMFTSTRFALIERRLHIQHQSLQLNRVPGVEAQFRPGHPARALPAQKQNRLRHFIRKRHPVQRIL